MTDDDNDDDNEDDDDEDDDDDDDDDNEDDDNEDDDDATAADAAYISSASASPVTSTASWILMPNSRLMGQLWLAPLARHAMPSIRPVHQASPS